MSSWSENWIYNLIPQEEYELAFDMVKGKSISCVLNQEEEIDYSKIEHVQEFLELTLMDILKSEDVNEKDVAEVSQKIYLLLSALPMPVDSIEKAKHVLKILVYSYIGEQWESGRRYLIENNINILVEEKDDWNICVFKKICNALFLPNGSTVKYEGLSRVKTIVPLSVFLGTIPSDFGLTLISSKGFFGVISNSRGSSAAQLKKLISSVCSRPL